MNKRLESVIRSLDIDPNKSKLIVCNSEIVTLEDAQNLFAHLTKYGHKEATIFLVKGDVRTAVEVYELPLPEEDK